MVFWGKYLNRSFLERELLVIGVVILVFEDVGRHFDGLKLIDQSALNSRVEESDCRL